jgi:hypothetical protein
VAPSTPCRTKKYKDALKIASIIEAGDEFYGMRHEEGQHGGPRPGEQGHQGRPGQGIDKELQKKWIGQ